MRTIEPGTKLVPFTVSVKEPLPATLDDGEMPVVVGAGLKTVTIGEEETAVSVPASEMRVVVEKMLDVPDAGALAPLAPPPAPYVTVTVWPPAICRSRTLMSP